MEYQPNRYQAAIYDFVENGEGNGQVNACAGTGKTTMLEGSARRIPRNQDIVYAAFNRHIKDEAEAKFADFQNVTVRTAHSLGYGSLYQGLGKRPNANQAWKKPREIAEEWLDKHHPGMKKAEKREAISNLSKLQDLARLNLVNPEDENEVLELLERYDLPLNGYHDGLAWCINRGVEMAQESGRIDYADMIFLPVHLEFPLKKTDWLLIDEAQDLSKAQRRMLMMMLRDDSRALAVGDVHQAIYGFAGADAESFSALGHELDATQLDLNICYRCPKSHIELAQGIVPQIEAFDGAPEGILEHYPYQAFDQNIQIGDVVLCRVTAPLIRECIKLIGKQIPAKVKGRDIGRQITSIVDQVAELPGYTYREFIAFLQVWHNKKIDYLVQKDASEAAFESLSDKVLCVEICYDAFNATNEWALKKSIENLFDDERGAVYFSTVHRAKGLEADRVHIIEPHKLPLVWQEQLPWQYTQEKNLEYVAYTRSKSELYIVDPM